MMLFGFNIHEKELRQIAVYIEKIMANPTEPSAEIEAFNNQLYDSGWASFSKGDNIWSEVVHLSDELDRYKPDATIDDKMVGYNDQARVVKLARNCLKIINAVLPKKKENPFLAFFKRR